MIFCFGVIPLKKDARGWSVLMILHKKGHWGLPKGHAEPNETKLQTAIRELKEETGLSISEFLDAPNFVETYFVEGEPKEVEYFLAEVKGHVHLQPSEVVAAAWFSLEEAEKVATFPAQKKVITDVIRHLQSD
jgi:bis(5'-nucleosidyl)-tetraphosphatase